MMMPTAPPTKALYPIHPHGTTPKDHDEINDEPDALYPPTAAACEKICRIVELVSWPKAYQIAPVITVVKILPLITAVIDSSIKGIAARSANGSILFPGSTIEIRIMIGINSKPLVKLALSPKNTAGSKEMKKFSLFISPLWILICIV